MLTRYTSSTKEIRPVRKDRGLVLMIVLIVLVAMTLAGLAMMRSVNMATLVTGNLALRQGGTHEGNVGLETAITWLQNNNSGTNLYNNISGAGYFATQAAPASGTSWDTFWKQTLASNAQSYTDPDTQNTISYVIHRLCNTAGAPTAVGTYCAFAPVATGSAGNSNTAGTIALQYSNQIYYRITVRIDGPHNSVNYVQAVVAL